MKMKSLFLANVIDVNCHLVSEIEIQREIKTFLFTLQSEYI